MATKSDIQGWIWTYQNTVENCNKQIDKLIPVYQALGDVKNEFRNARKSTEDIFEEKGMWRGEKYTSFCRAGDTLDSTCREYYKRLDAAQDAVNKKIGELKAKKFELIPIINSLAAQIEDMKTDVENALN